MAIESVNSQAMNFATAFRGLYVRVASRLNVDPSYVSRVARGERESKEVVEALDREMRQIMKVLQFTQNGSGRSRVGRRRIKKTERAA
jgi:hypothetical protein